MYACGSDISISPIPSSGSWCGLMTPIGDGIACPSFLLRDDDDPAVGFMSGLGRVFACLPSGPPTPPAPFVAAEPVPLELRLLPLELVVRRLVTGDPGADVRRWCCCWASRCGDMVMDDVCASRCGDMPGL